MTVSWRKQGSCGFVELNNPPVNAINRAIRKGLSEAVAWAESQQLSRVILSGAGGVFAAGADAGEFDTPPEAPHLPDVLQQIEVSPVPWIAALHGAVLGGGAELALACRYRLARADASIGFPEVILGVVPGAGGTQRLPRLVGMMAALRLIPTGRPVSGDAAQQMGLVDGVCDDPLASAMQITDDQLAEAVPVAERVVDSLGDDEFDAARDTALRRMRGQDAPLIAIDLLRSASTQTLATGLQRERAAFLTLRQSKQARALRHIFFAERGAKIPAVLKPHMKMPKQVAVVGGGTMGAGIAYSFLRAAIPVRLVETGGDGLQRAAANIEKIILSSLSAGHIDEATAGRCRDHLTLTTDFSDLGDVDLAIEAVFEDLTVKQEVLTKLQTAAPGAVLATNTSYLDIDRMAEMLADPSRLIGLHFFAPAHIMKLLEIVYAQATVPAAVAMAFSIAKRLGKIPVVAGVCDGFIGNRILARYREVADSLLIDGSTPWDIDRAMVDFGFPMGPYEAQDLSGLDIAHANRRRLDSSRDPARRYIPISDQVVMAGRLGRKTGAGWYRYTAGGGKDIDPVIETMILEAAASAGINRCVFTPSDIQNRLLLAMINEAANILLEGIAATTADIDLVLVHGFGFPRWRGGAFALRRPDRR
ncbi:3-hydroxyacyl-CoA dehydrogenase NAD-binding domain-containing protein [Alphaproteobacteria bacterium]|nr:3-hydroxyacyl-CoA dehydrogenase NAD-binding domain-containing protein [Alphaproteobacteria bacterium]